MTERYADKRAELRGKRATVLGLGREGVAVVRFLAKRGAEITISDAKPVESLKESLAQIAGLPVNLSLGANRIEDTTAADIIFVSPGVPLDLPPLKVARERGIPLSSSTKLFFQECPAPIIGITGSSGKTTTTALTGEIFRTAGKDVLVGGNIGRPLLSELEQMTPESWVVLEMSSYQLDILAVSPHVAAVLNITPNHLDMHHTMEEYVRAKKNIVSYQKPEDFAILNYDDPIVREFSRKCPGQVLFFSRRTELEDDGAFLDEGRFAVRYRGEERVICSTSEIGLLGQHNWDNILVASAIATVCGIPVEPITRAVTSFKGIEHRLEWVRAFNGVDYYNDSIATTPERAIAGLLAFDKPIILLAGGKDKHLPLETLAQTALDKCKAVVLFGEARERMAETLQAIGKTRAAQSQPLLYCQYSLAEAVESAHRIAAASDVVLLSPACSSFDAFRDFEERGREFKRLVNELK